MNKLFGLLLIIGMLSCSYFDLTDPVIPQEDLSIEEFKLYGLPSYDLLRDNASTVSRTTINQTGNVGGFEDGIIQNYPEQGQDTTFTVTLITGDLYQVTAITTYPNADRLLQTVEEYRVFDADGNGIWNENDTIVDGSGMTNTKFRYTYKTYLSDFTQRDEIIVEDKATDGVNYKIFDDFSDFSFPTSESELLGTSSQWSSKVAYYMSIPFWSDNSFWKSWSSKKMIGLRYYSEIINGSGQLEQSYVIYEKILNGNVDVSDATDTKMFGDSGFKELSYSVLKVHIVDGVKTIQGVYYLYDTNRLRSTLVVDDYITLEIID